MRIAGGLIVMLLLGCYGLVTAAQGLPRMSAVEPAQGKAGDELTITGENLEKKNVAEIFFTDGKSDIKLPVVSQTATTIKFKIPPEAKPGRFNLMLMTTGDEPKLIEQPIKVTVQ